MGKLRKEFVLLYVLVALFTLFSGQVKAQSTPTTIKGIIVDGKSKIPVPYVTLTLKYSHDSSSFQSVFSDTTGRFSFSVEASKFFLQANRLGYDEIRYRLVDVSKDIKNTMLDSIFMIPQSVILNEVVISAKRPIILTTPRGYQVEVEFNPVINKNNSVFEALRCIPGVIIDGDQISLLGRSDVLFQINGIDKKLPPEALANLLKSMQADKLSKIEVVRNPGAEYDASTTSIINLILKKNLMSGFFGNVNTYLSTYHKAGAGASFSLIQPKISYTLTLNYRKNNSFSETSSRLHFFENNVSSHEYIENTDSEPIQNDIITIFQEFNCRIKPNLTVGGSLNYYGYKSYTKTLSDLYVALLDTIGPLSSQNRIEDKSNFNNLSFDAFLKYDLSSKENLIIQGNFYYYYTPSKMLIYSSSGNPILSNDNYQRIENRDVTSFTGKVIYQNKLNSIIAWKYGMEYSEVLYSSGMTENTLPNSDLLHDIDRSYDCNEKNLGAFVDFAIQRKKWGFQLGLRGEYALRKLIASQTNNPDYSLKRQDQGIYPIFSTNYKIADNQSISFAIKHSITRPQYSNYVPFEWIISSSLTSKGNPEINPYYTNNIDFTYQFQVNQNHIIMINGGINSSNGVILPGIIYNNDSKILVASPFNLADLFDIYGTISLQNNICSWLTCQTSLSMTKSKYYQYISEDFKGPDNNMVKFSISENVSFVLPLKLNLNLYYTFISASTTAQGSQLPYHMIYAIASRDFLKNKLNISLSIRNPFISGKSSTVYQTLSFISTQTTFSENNILKINLRFKFGKTKRSDQAVPEKITNSRL